MKPLARIRRITAAVIAAALAVPLVSCETAEGFGRDVRRAGSGIERTAERASY
jgi:predicted small secreted protein